MNINLQIHSTPFRKLIYYFSILLLITKINAATPIIKLACDDGVFIPTLTEALGYYEIEGIIIKPVKIEDFEKDDYLLQSPLIKGQVDAVYHWYHHTIFGARHGLPVKAVMLFNDAPGISIFVSNNIVNKIHSASDFKGLRIAEGASYGTKSVLTEYLTLKSGLPLNSYTAILKDTTGRQEAVVNALRHNQVDIMTFQEPLSSALSSTGLVTLLYDFNNAESTHAILGSSFPSQCLIMAPEYIKKFPALTQKLVNAFVRTMRYINSHTTEEILAKIPESYFDGKNKNAEIQLIKSTLSTYAKNDYSIHLDGAKLVYDIVQSAQFDNSTEGTWRKENLTRFTDYKTCFTNDFVNVAMSRIK